ncbi:MAG: histidine kinase dimerization/phosphoacceptor domain -containing protein [Bacteroidota bacterium]
MFDMLNNVNLKEVLYSLPLGIIWIENEKIIYFNTSAKKQLNLDTLNKNNFCPAIDSIFSLESIQKLKKIKVTDNKKLSLEIIGDKSQNINLASEACLISKDILQVSFTLKEKNTENKQLNTILETSDHLVWLVNKKFELTNFNLNFSQLIFEKYNIKITKGTNVSALLNKESKKYTDYWHPRYKEVFSGLSLNFIKEENSGKYICREVFINPVFSDNQSIDEICCVGHDITDSVLYERKVNSQKGRLTAIFDSSQHYIWTIDREEKLTSFNKNYFDLVSGLYHTQPYVGIVLNRGFLANDKKYTQTLNLHYQKAFKGNATSFEVEIQDEGKGNIYLEIFLNPIYNKNKVVEVSGIAHNITEKKLVQQKMEFSLKEKEVLLKEVHHRVKNNMQVISSILNLQSFYVKDQYTLGLLKESQNRISTMAYIHESLYQNNSFSAVNFSEYVKRLVRNIIASYSFNSDNIELKQEIDEIALSLDVAIPLGLIINELVTNSIKHAFNNQEKGLIIINLKTENNYVFLNLMDNGIGLNDGFNIEKSQSLGLQLVSTLLEQIGATYTLKSNKNQGTKFNISFQI